MFPPEILNLPNTINIAENAVVSNVALYTVTTRDNDTVVSTNIITNHDCLIKLAVDSAYLDP